MTDPSPSELTGAEVVEMETPLQRRMAAGIVHELHRQGLTQKALAIRCDLSEKHVSRILRGRDEGSFVVWQRMAAMLGKRWTVDLDD